MSFLHYYWKKFVIEKDGLLDITKLDFQEIDLEPATTLKRAEHWAGCIYYLIELNYLGVLALVQGPRDVKAEIKDLKWEKPQPHGIDILDFKDLNYMASRFYIRRLRKIKFGVQI